MSVKLKNTPLRCPCNGDYFAKAFVYDAPPEGETRFSFSSENYHREVWQCQICHHFVSTCDMDLSELYREDYVSSTYGEKGIKHTFDRIISLPPGKSDNIGRVQRIVEFAENYLKLPAAENRPPRILDVGSGLGVFPYQIQKAGWKVTALDPDPRMVAHIREAIGTNTVCGNFMELSDLGRFDIISFNKVLEHVEDPVTMLAKSQQHLNKGGIVYIEIPDGEASAMRGKGREEFFIEHFHIFSIASIALLASRAGFQPIKIERLQEPSTKYTLRAFLRL